MSDLKTLLRAYVDETVERVDVADLNIEVVKPQGRSLGWRRPALVVAAAAAVAVVLVGGVALLVTGGGDPTVADEPTTITTPTTTVPTTAVTTTTLAPATTAEPDATTAAPATSTLPPTTIASPPTVPPMPDALAMTWTRVEHGAQFERAWMTAIAPAGPGLVAVGATDGYRSDAAVWTSPDGVTWTRVDSDSFAGVANEVGNDEDQFMTDVVAGPAGIVAVGADGSVSMFVSSNPPLPNGNAAVWVSPDGATWARTSETALESDGYQVMQAVAAGPGGLVAVGSTVTDPSADGLGRAAVWTSEDGLAWAPVPAADLPQPPPPDEPGIPASAGMTDVVWWSDRFVAVGATLPEWGFSDYSQPAIWTSPDGRSWDLVYVGDRGWIDAVTTTGAGILALGNSSEGGAPTPVAWTSVDGSSWQRVDTALFETVDPDDAHWATFVTATSEGYLAIGHTAGSRAGNYYPLAAPHKATPEIWGSTDGVTWHLIAELGQVSRVPAVTDAFRTVMGEVLLVGDVAIAVGSDGVYQSQEAEGLHNHCKVVYSGWCRTDAAVWIGTFSR